MHHYWKKRNNGSTSEMIHLCQQGQWMKAAQLIKDFPDLAFIQESTTYGDSTTVVAVAIRSGCICPSSLEALLLANPSQTKAIHRHHGTILHDLFQFGRFYFNSSSSLNDSTRSHDIGELASFFLQKIVHAVAQPVQTYRSNLTEPFESADDDNEFLATKDAMGRTILHMLAEYIIDHGLTNGDSLRMFAEQFLKVCPTTLRMTDTDGNTPLIILLTAMPECIFETELSHIVCQFLHVDPYCATISRKVFTHSFPYTATPPSSKLSDNPTGSYGVHTDSSDETMLVMNTPLYFSLLHKRSLSVVKALVNAINETIGKGANEIPIVTRYCETCLHICITTRASLDIVQEVLNHDPEAVMMSDMYGLTPIDWVWLCHVVDWNYEEQEGNLIPDYHLDFMRKNYTHLLESSTHGTNQAVQSHRMISRRRNLGGSLFERWFQNAETSFLAEKRGMADLCDELDLEPSVGNITIHSNVRRRREKHLYRFLGDRIRLMLPIAGDSCLRTLRSPFCLQSKQWLRDSTVVHAACLIRCPLAVVHGAKLIAMDTASTQGRQNHHRDKEEQFNKVCYHRDALLGRHPLHYACLRFEYIAHYPVRPSLSYRGGIQTHYEPSPVHSILPCFPIAASAADFDYRLPIHIVLDALHDSRAKQQIISDEVESQVIQCLLEANPSSIDRRDGRTKLYPWQQAAVGDFANLNTIFRLLRMQPTLVSR